MAKLNQIIPIATTRKRTAQAAWTETFRNVQKAPLLSGITRTYQPKDDDGEQLPSESTRVQVTTTGALNQFRADVSSMFDVVAQLDETNTQARGDVVVDGVPVLAGVPVTYLMFLAKQLVDVKTFVSKLPVLDPSDEWTLDPNTGVYKTGVTGTTRTKKVPKNWVKAVATDKHPAQVEMFTEDVIVGLWSTTKFSGAMPATEKAALLARVTKFQEAVTAAQEQANMAEVAPVTVADQIFGYLLGS